MKVHIRWIAALSSLAIATAVSAQGNPPAGGREGRGAGAAGGRGSGGDSTRVRTLPAWRGPMDTARVRQLYVPTSPSELRGCASAGGDGSSLDECSNRQKRTDDSTWMANAAAKKYTYEKITYRSDVDGLEIPAAIIAPLDKSVKHPTLVWIHGGVHASWTTELFPFVVEAIQRGYVIVAPDYRGSTGYGDAFYRKIDYGG